ncbi:aminopeptidase [Papiliotrema laurentii]|uniref:aspartyl aminopeptidase n=2 Tax=Opisthokonta TaxID=33154 RepID=A0AAD9L6Q9_PAPLA|nr:aminopeptidase [Papiliotrema laurentii]
MQLPPSPPVDAVKFCDFVTASPTPFHAVHNISKRLVSAGFKAISERSVDPATLTAGGKFFYTRNQSSIVAFTLPPSPSPSTAVSFAVGHLDSPCLKVRPISKKTKDGYLQVGVELYGGGIWHSWFDRDLSLAGRVIVADSKGQDPTFTSKLVKIDRPILRIPTLAIHLDRTMNEAFKFNKETNYRPILGLVAEQLNSTGAEGKDKSRSGTPIPFSGTSTPGEQKKPEEDVSKMSERHHPLLLAVLADELGCEIGDIHDFELSLFDVQPSTVGGLSNEFVFSPRIDNLMTCFASIEGLCEASEKDRVAEENNIHCVILFDNEEVGSVSHHGAESNLLPSFVERIVSLPDYKHAGYHQVLSNSFLVSADMGHAINPNYADRYEPDHAPKINGGVVIKTNANQRYTSNAQTTFLLRNVAKKAGVPVQEFEIRNDSSCGSTVGPHLSTHVRTVDIGLAQLAMHSIRETAGSADVRHYIDLFRTYFEAFSKIDQALKVD